MPVRRQASLIEIAWLMRSSLGLRARSKSSAARPCANARNSAISASGLARRRGGSGFRPKPPTHVAPDKALVAYRQPPARSQVGERRQFQQRTGGVAQQQRGDVEQQLVHQAGGEQRAAQGGAGFHVHFVDVARGEFG